MVKLYDHQAEAVRKMFSGCILYGKVGSGKSLTSLFFYKQSYKNRKLYVITTAKKRDSGEWQEDLELLDLTGIVDSWQNIQKYVSESNAFFIFDEQRSSGMGKWGKSFIRIAKQNTWVLLTGTPGDTWMDYVNVFIANGFYKNKSHFVREHVNYDSYAKYPRIKGYFNEGRLLAYRNKILVVMPFKKHTKRNRCYHECEYDKELYNDTMRLRWDHIEECPIENVSKLTSCLRYIVNSDLRRKAALALLLEDIPKTIVFYNFNYELEIIKAVCNDLQINYREWNGQRHESVPKTKKWVYIVQYTAGAEGWNCTDTDTIIFFSMNYSYKVLEQAEGRIDRLNTPYTDLFYYYLTSKSPIDKAIRVAINKKTRFNENGWAKKVGFIENA